MIRGEAKAEHSLSIGRSRIVLGLTLAVVIATGLASRKYAELLPSVIADNAGDILWTVAAFLGWGILFPNWKSSTLGLIALVLSFAIEFSQLIDHGPLNRLRQHRIGQLFLGSGFLWFDLVRYSLGAVLATALDYAVLQFVGLAKRYFGFEEKKLP